MLTGQQGCLFSNNVANEGGALHLFKSVNTSMSDIQFIKNSGNGSAAVQLMNSSISFVRVSFRENVCTVQIFF